MAVKQSNILYTVDEIARILKVDTEMVYRALNNGTLKGSKIGGKLWRISQQALDDFLNGGAK